MNEKVEKIRQFLMYKNVSTYLENCYNSGKCSAFQNGDGVVS